LDYAPAAALPLHAAYTCHTGTYTFSAPSSCCHSFTTRFTATFGSVRHPAAAVAGSSAWSTFTRTVGHYTLFCTLRLPFAYVPHTPPHYASATPFHYLPHTCTAPLPGRLRFVPTPRSTCTTYRFYRCLLDPYGFTDGPLYTTRPYVLAFTIRAAVTLPCLWFPLLHRHHRPHLPLYLYTLPHAPLPPRASGPRYYRAAPHLPPHFLFTVGLTCYLLYCGYLTHYIIYDTYPSLPHLLPTGLWTTFVRATHAIAFTAYHLPALCYATHCYTTIPFRTTPLPLPHTTTILTFIYLVIVRKNSCGSPHLQFHQLRPRTPHCCPCRAATHARTIPWFHWTHLTLCPTHTLPVATTPTPCTVPRVQWTVPMPTWDVHCPTLHTFLLPGHTHYIYIPHTALTYTLCSELGLWDCTHSMPCLQPHLLHLYLPSTTYHLCWWCTDTHSPSALWTLVPPHCVRAHTAWFTLPLPFCISAAVARTFCCGHTFLHHGGLFPYPTHSLYHITTPPWTYISEHLCTPLHHTTATATHTLPATVPPPPPHHTCHCGSSLLPRITRFTFCAAFSHR